MITLTDKQIQSLCFSRSQSFLFEQYDRFEILDGDVSDENENKFHMAWYHNQLEALFAFNYFSEKVPTALLWDMAEIPEPCFCLRIGIPWGEILEEAEQDK